MDESTQNKRIADWIKAVWKAIGDLNDRIDAVQHQLNSIQPILPPRQIQIGDRVKANAKASFHVGAEGVVQFVEPSYEKVWVLRDRSSSPVFYAPKELDVITKVGDVVETN
jgi:hypothetical protein